MKRFLTLLMLAACASFAAARAAGQTPSPSPAAPPADADVAATYVFGDVTSIEAESRRLTVKTKTGEFTVHLSEATKYLRVAPGEASLDKAAPITLADVGVGDRVLARGKVSVEQRSVPARQLIVMNKAEMAQKQQRDLEEWRRRGVAGRVAALNPATREITLTVAGQREASVILDAKGPVVYRRYLPDSVRVTDAAQSSFEQLAVGDHVRALGDRQGDGSRIVAEEILSGAFRAVNGVVTGVNASANELTIKDLATGQPLTVVVSEHSLMRRLSPEIVELIKRGAAERGAAGGVQTAAAAGAQSGGQDVKALVEKLPPITISDLKAGDAVRVSSTVGSAPSRLTAIAVAAGIEPLLTSAKGKPLTASAGASLGLSSGALDGLGLP